MLKNGAIYLKVLQNWCVSLLVETLNVDVFSLQIYERL